MKNRIMICGAGSYCQGENILEKCGTELVRKDFRKAFIIGGMNALGAAGQILYQSLEREKITFTVHRFFGFCTVSEIDALVAQAGNEKCDVVLGVGGGKALDVSKAVAAVLNIPVYTIPTCAATCAAFAALSIIYTEKGFQDHTRYHLDEVEGVFVDTGILSRAPARYLAAGMADAMAKTCEYSSMRNQLSYGDVDISKYLGYRMAQAGDEILMTCGLQAYKDNCTGIVSSSFEDAVYVVIAATGIVSGMGGFAGRTGSRFAIAHGFNEVLRGRYTDTKRWLHGELVAVGVLAQLHANGVSYEYLQQVRAFYQSVHIPVTLEQLGIVLDRDGFAVLQEEIVQHSAVEPVYSQRVRKAVESVRE